MRTHITEGAERDTVSRSNLSAKRLIAVGGTVVALAAGSAFAAGPAFAAPSITLTGTVADGTTAVADAHVTIERWNDYYGDWENATSTTTGTDGSWSIDGSGLGDGKYATFYDVSDSAQALYSQDQGWDGTEYVNGSIPNALGTEFVISGDTTTKSTFTESLVHNAGAATVRLKDADTGGVLNGATDGSYGGFDVDEGYTTTGQYANGNSAEQDGADFTGTITVGHLVAGTYYDSEVYSSNHNDEPIDTFSVATNATTNLGDVSLYDYTHDTVRVDGPEYITITGTPKVGTLLTANLPANNATSVSYTWFTEDSVIPGATGQTFVPTANLIGKQIYVEANLRAPGLVSYDELDTLVDTPVVQVGDANQAVVTIIGKPKFDQTLKAAVASPTVADAKYTYQWYANGAVLVGADSSSYVVKKSQTGASLVVSVSSVAQGHTAGVIPSAAVTVAKDVVKLTATTTKKITKSTKPKVKVSVKAGNSKVTATGKVKVYYSSKKYKTVSVTSKSKSAKSVTLPKLSKGTHTIKVVFPASTHYASKTVKIKVTVTK